VSAQPTAGGPLSLLAITTSVQTEAALLHDGRIQTAAGDGQALAALLPAVRSLLSGARLEAKTLDAIAICTGPGSFTGLRIGMAFAKTLAQVHDLPMIAVSAFDVAELSAPGEIAQYPLVALAMGKPDLHYARSRRSADDKGHRFTADRTGLQAEIDRLTRECAAAVRVVGADLSSYKAGERAQRVALLGERAWRDGRVVRWRDIAIDYGQRPNAVVNWERRQARAAEGQPQKPRE